MPNTHSTLTGLFSDIADSIREKTGSADTIVADAFPDAIGAIPTLPALDRPAAAGDILAGKEAVGTDGEKLTGTLSVCDSLLIDESPFSDEGTCQIIVRSAKDGSSATLEWAEPDCLAENIVSGKTVLGVTGSCKCVTSLCGTKTVGASDAQSLAVASVGTPHTFSLLLPTEQAIALAAQKGTSVIAQFDVYLSDAFGAYGAATIYNPEGFQSTAALPAILTNNRITVFAKNSGIIFTEACFPAAAEYQWKATDWEDAPAAEGGNL